MRRAAAYLALACAICLAAYYVGFASRATLRIEGERPVALVEFGRGASITHAFMMNDELLHGVSVRILSDRSSSSQVVCKLARLHDPDPQAPNNPNQYTTLYAWTTAVDVQTGDHWYRFEFPTLTDANNHWYAFEIRLVDDRSDQDRVAGAGVGPTMSLMASESNPDRGGKLWIDTVRQPGSLFIRASGSTVYDRFRLHIEPGLPPILRHRAVQIGVALIALWAVVTLTYAIVFAQGKDRQPEAPFRSGGVRTVDDRQPSVVSVGQVVVITLALAAFFLVPDNFPDNPSNRYPLVPELVFLGALCLIAAVSLPRRNADDRGSSLGWDEIVCYALFALCFGYTAFQAIRSGVANPLGFDPCGSVAPSGIVRLECRLEASFSQNYAWRNFSHLIALTAIAIVTSVMTRAIPGFFRRALTAIMLVGMAHALSGLAAIWFHVYQVLPKWIMVNSYADDRFTFLIPYPGYVSAHMAPAFSITAWYSTYAATSTRRLAGLLSSIALASAICATWQRTGLLLVLAVACLCCVAVIIQAAQQSARRGLPVAAVQLVVCAAICLGLFYPIFVTWSMWGTQFFDPFRVRIGKVVVGAVLATHPIAGFGYARWGEFATVARTTPAAAFIDSAHSVWVRVFFELGPTGLVLVAGCFVAAVVMAIRNAGVLRGGRFLVICAAATVLIAMSFDEIDSQRPVAVTQAFMAGVCIGLPFRRTRVVTEDLSRNLS